MTPLGIFGWALAIGYVATIVGAWMDTTQRSRTREVIDALALPLSVFMSGSRKRKLSGLRVILGLCTYAFLVNFPAFSGRDAVWALAILVFALIVDTLFAAVPAREMLTALLAYFGGKVAERTTSVTVDTKGGGGGGTITVEQEQPDQAKLAADAPEPKPAADGALG